MSVMTLFAASSLVVSCYDDSKLWDEMNDVKEQLTTLDQKIEAVKAQLETLAASVDGLYTLTFQASSSNELQYSFDGGKTWKGTGINLAEECDAPCTAPCECPKVSLVDNGDTVTITVGNQSYTIEKPKEIAFEIRAGKVYFESEGTVTVAIKSLGIEDVSVLSAPKGWWAEITSEGKLEVTAPNYDETQAEFDYDTWEEIPAKYAASGYVKVHACGVDGSCMVGKLPVEVVSQALSVKAYAGMAYFTVANTSYYAPTFFYGASTPESLKADTEGLIAGMRDGNYEVYEEYLNNDGESVIEVSVAELLGEEPQVGSEYIVWALVWDYEATEESLVRAYYSPVSVDIKEVEAERTAYNVTVNVDVVGAEGYVAVAMPESQLQWTSVEDIKEQMAMALAEGQYYGKLYKESYNGSALDIAAGTSYSMTGNYSPNAGVYVFVLPLDNRSAQDYTPEDVVVGEFKTAELVEGGSIDVVATQVTSYMGEVYSYEIWDYVKQEIVLDPYTQLGVEVNFSNNNDWAAFYYTWMSEADYALYGSDDALVVDYLLENTYGNLPDEVDELPLYVVEKTSQNTTLHFVAFVVDAAGKYGKVAHVEATSKELQKADLTWAEPVKTNVKDGVLKNSQTLEITPVFEEGTEPAYYKYVLAQTRYYNQYEGMTDTEMAEELFFSTSSSVKKVTAEELVNGVLYVDGHSYGYPYYFAIVPVDAEGNPGASAYIMEYECVFAIDHVTTEGAEYNATEPTVKVLLPEEWECYPDGEWGDAAYYGYEYQSYYSKYNYYYEVAYTVNPVEGTEVCSVLVDTDSYTLGADAATKAGQVWGGSLGSWNTNTTTEYYESSYRYFNNYDDEPAPALVLCVSWKDAEGNLYYKEYDLQDDMQHYADLMTEYIAGTKEIPAKPEAALSVDGKQWAFMFEMMGVDVRMDLGVSIPDYCMIGYDLSLMYGDELPEEMIGTWMAYLEGYYEVEATDATSGNIWLLQQDWETGELSRSMAIQYSDLTAETVVLTCEAFGLVDVVATFCEENVPMMSQGIAM